MATVTVLSVPPPPLPSAMAAKRVPLANNPNAANSPFRASAAAKRPRLATHEQRDNDAAQSPPKKKQLLDLNDAGGRHVHHVAPDDRGGKIFGPRAENTLPNAFQRKLVAAARESKLRENKQPEQKDKDKHSHTDVDTIRQWRRHYRKVFPSFVFYLESLPQDVCIRCSRQITTLGAREEKFFSKAVTHIVTTRPIPPGLAETDSSVNQSSSSKNEGHSQQSAHASTINPSLLDKHLDPQSKALVQKTRHVSDHASQKRPQPSWPQSGNADVLIKAREMGIKIWPLEKFDRMMRAIFDTEHADTDEHVTARKAASLTRGAGHGKDLSQLLQNEKNLPGERPPWTGITPFQGFYIYIHDIDEKTKPVMVRDYPKVVNREDGEWPQFRCIPAPKCPFIIDDSVGKRECRPKEQVKEKTEQQQQPPRTRAATAARGEKDATVAKEQQPSTNAAKQGVLQETDSNARSMPKPVAAPAPPSAKSFEPPQLKHTDSLPPQLTNRFQVPGMPRPAAGREPVASGLQRSNQTSAIRSQIISSTAANPSAKAGTSKEMHQLQRRAVEHRHRTTLSVTSVPSSYMNEMRAAINDDHIPAHTRTSRRKPAEPLTRITEDETQSEEEEEHARQVSKTTKVQKKKPSVAREPKPGYCENCRDKYEDFNEHVLSRKHRKFALTPENWTELDSLLRELFRR